MKYAIDRAAVIGAGTMGAAIAAHLANARIPVYLLDIVPDTLTPGEADAGMTLADVVVRNRLVNAGFERAKKSSPPAFMSKECEALITTGNTVDHMNWLAEVDWIIEAVVENLPAKRALMARLEAVRKPGAIVSTNTSGIPVAAIARDCSADFKRHFLGTHFFNPPRWMKLLEIVPAAETLPAVLSFMQAFGERTLGKGVVVCKDTPSFIGNRLASMTGAYALAYALDHGCTVEEVDSLTGQLVGRPKTGQFRLMDLIGLDVAAAVQANLYPGIAHDEAREVLRAPKMLALTQEMLKRGWLGNKAGQGFYKEVKDASGKREFWHLNLETLEYQPPGEVRFASVGKARKIEDLAERLRILFAEHDRASEFVWATTAWSFSYASRRVPWIADSFTSIDQATKWGFGHEAGPFEIWDGLGVEATAERMEAEGLKVADWVKDMLASGRSTFYQYERGRKIGYYNVVAHEYQPLPEDKNVIVLKELKSQGKEIRQNLSASLIDLGDGVACLEFHSKMNALDNDIGDMIVEAVGEVQRNFVGLVVGNQGEHFCVGANIFSVAVAAQQGAWHELDAALKGMQDALMALRYSPKPVVAAPFSMALGGGAEVAMAAARICSAADLFIGQVEMGVGLIPAAGGCKELLRRVVAPPMKTPGTNPLPFVQRIFELIGMARVSGSALEAREQGFLAEGDRIVMNRDHLLAEAKLEVLALAATDYRPPVRGKIIYAAGRDAYATVIAGIHQMEKGKYISAHDAVIARKLAYVLCGGELSEGQWVDEQYILDLEREAFLTLLHEPKTLERLWHMLQHGKPLRN